MNNFRNVNNDILKDWFLFREDEIASLTCDEDKHHWVYFDEISERILRNVPDKIKSMSKNNLIFLMIILGIILVIEFYLFPTFIFYNSESLSL